MALTLITPPTAEPLTVELVKKHLNQDGIDPQLQDTAEVNMLQGFISAARRSCEGFTHRALMTQTWQFFPDGWCEREIYIPKPPFQSFDFFKYRDIAGAEQTLLECAADGTPVSGQTYGYQLDPGGDTLPAYVAPPWVTPWPPLRRIINNVTMEFVCGYRDVPVNILSITRSSGIVTVTTDSPCLGMVGGDVTIAGVVSATTSFNGTFVINADPSRVFKYQQAGADEPGTDVHLATASAAASGVPFDLKVGMLWLIAFMYANREGGRWMPPGGGTQGQEVLPDTVRSIWEDYRCHIV